MNSFLAAIKFHVHHVWFMGRDRLRPPLEMVRPIGIEPGDTVVDYGCGAGSYTLPAAALTGPEGHVYAADINRHALDHVRRVLAEQSVRNVTVVETDRALPVPSQTVDVAMLNDVIHDVRDQQGLLAELHRVLKPQGVLAIRDHHHSRRRLEATLGQRGLFRLVSSEGGLHRFAPQQEPAVEEAVARE